MIKKSVLLALQDILEEHLSHDDYEKGVRISPRRWEQIILYISNAFPITSSAEADALLDNLKINFTNYMTGDSASISNEVIKRIQSLIRQKFNIEVDASKPVDESNWERNLEHQIAMKLKMGDNRTYIPVISGPPGIGKTTIVRQIAKKLDMKYIEIDSSTLNVDDVIGLPIPTDEGGVEFSVAKLQKIIQRQVKEQAGQDKNNGYLLFFDELNRVESDKVFNAIRRVILDKRMGHRDKDKLPPKTLILAAINPDDLGTLELTDHMRDVMDIIPAGPNFNKLKSYLKNAIPKIKVKNENVKTAATHAFEIFIKKFSGKPKAGKDSAFYLDVGTELYASPREYTQLVAEAIKSLDKVVRRQINQSETEQIVRSTLYKSFAKTLKNIAIKHDAYDPNWFNTLQQWFMSSDELTVAIEDVITVKSKTLENLNLIDIITPYLEKHDQHLYNNKKLINYLKNASANSLSRDWEGVIKAIFNDFERVKNAALKATHPQKELELEKETVNVLEENITEVEYILREMVHALAMYNVVPGGLDAIVESTMEALSDSMDFGDSESLDVYNEIIELGNKLRNYINNIGD